MGEMLRAAAGAADWIVLREVVDDRFKLADTLVPLLTPAADDGKFWSCVTGRLTFGGASGGSSAP